MHDVFAAVAEPTRRRILDRLRTEGPLSVSVLAASEESTRQAVTKHLDVLEEAGLVHSERQGRMRIHRLTAEPLREVDEWLSAYSAQWDRRLERLRAHVESDGEVDDGPER